MCQGFSHFSGILHHFVLAKLANSSIRVKTLIKHLNHNHALPVDCVVGTSVVEVAGGVDVGQGMG